MQYDPVHTPLAPEPRWTPDGTASAKFYRRTDGPSISDPPRAHARGFEEGAYALAHVLNEALARNDTESLVAILSAYRAGLAHPAAGWHNEPVRS